MQTIKFETLKNKFPKKRWMHIRNEKRDGKFEQENACHIEADYETDNLNLHSYLINKNCIAVLIDGNLTIKNIFNKNTGSAISLKATTMRLTPLLQSDRIIYWAKENLVL